VKDLMNSLPQVGEVVWLGIRPSRRASVHAIECVMLDVVDGVAGDHFNGAAGSKRQVTLFQDEHLRTIGELLHREAVDPLDVRRNIVVRGINLLALKDQEFRIGDALLCGTGTCPPCSRMEENLGPGGYNAMRGHGGITARVVQSGLVSVGNPVSRCVVKDASATSCHTPGGPAK